MLHFLSNAIFVNGFVVIQYSTYFVVTERLFWMVQCMEGDSKRSVSENILF